MDKINKRVKFGVVGLVCLAIAIINPLQDTAMDQIIAGLGNAISLLNLMKKNCN